MKNKILLAVYWVDGEMAWCASCLEELCDAINNSGFECSPEFAGWIKHTVSAEYKVTQRYAENLFGEDMHAAITFLRF